MVNLQNNLASGGGVSSGGADFQPPVEGTADHPVFVYPGPFIIGFQITITYMAHTALFYYFNPDMFPPQNPWNMDAVTSAVPTPSPANQDRRQTHYNHAAAPSYSSVLMRTVPAATGSVTSGPYGIYNQNRNLHQINNNYHFNVSPDGITHNHNINNDDEDGLFPSDYEEFTSWEEAMDAAANDELSAAILESDSNYFLYRGSGSGLPENTISNYLKTRKITHQDPSSSDICVVCQDDICLKEKGDEELIATLDCRHEFHADCIKQWLKQKNICPLCKARALPLDS